MNVFDYKNIVSMDVLLREDPAAFDRCFMLVVERMVAVLEALRKPKTHDVSLPIKERPYGGLRTAVNFKGFEIRNIGLARTIDGRVDPSDIVIFDCVRPYLAPIEEAAAKLIVSIGLLNWGMPLSRFARGPNTELMHAAAGPV